MRAIAKLTWVELKLFLREPLGAFFTLAFPVLLLLLFGGIFGNAPDPDRGGFGFVDVMVPAYTALVIATTALLSLPTTLASYREQGVLRRLHATPLHPLGILVAHCVVLFVATTAGMALLLVTGKLVFNLRSAGHPVVLATAFGFCCAALLAVGFLLASIVPGARSAQAVGMTIFYPMIFLSGAALPRDLLPESVQRAAVVLPLTQVVSLLQSLWMGDGWSAHVVDTVVLAAWACTAMFAAVRVFRWE